ALVEPDPLGGAVVGADDGRVAARAAGAEVVLLQHRDVRDAEVLRQVVRGRHAVPAAADDHDVVGLLQLGPLPPGATLEETTHAVTPIGSLSGVAMASRPTAGPE